MSQFYKKVATPETQRVQSAAPRGATQDAQARIDANKKGFADSIQSLLGVTATVVQAQKQSDERQIKTEEAKDGAAADVTYKEEYTPLVQSELEELTEGDLDKMNDPSYYEQAAQKARNKLASEGGLSDSLLNSLDRRIESYSSLAQTRHKQQIRKKRVASSIDKMVQGKGAQVFSSLDPEETTLLLEADIQNKKETGYFDDLGITEEEYKKQFASALINKGMQAGGAAIVNTRDMINSKGFQDSFLAGMDEEEKDAFVSTTETLASTAVVKRKQEELQKIETEAYSAEQFNAFTSTDAVDKYFDKRLSHLKSWQMPFQKDIERIKNDIKKGVAVTKGVDWYRGELSAGNQTVLETSGLSKKNQDAIHSKFASNTLGVMGLDFGIIDDMLLSGDKDSELAAVHSTTGKAIHEMIVYFNSVPNTFQGQVRQSTAFSNLKAQLMGTPQAHLIHEYASPEVDTRLTYLNSLAVDHTNLKSDANLSKEQAQMAMAEFDSNRKRDTNSRNLYRSEEAIAVLKDEKIQKEVQEFAEEGSGFFQDSTAQNYKKEALENIIALKTAAGIPKENVLEEAQEVYAARHATFNQPNGDEGVLPFEWKDVKQEDVHAMLKHAPELQSYRDAALLFGYGNKYDIEDFKLEPSNAYNANKDMAIVVGNIPIATISRKKFDRIVKYAYSKETESLRNEYQAARKRQANVGAARRGFKAINADTLKEK